MAKLAVVIVEISYDIECLFNWVSMPVICKVYAFNTGLLYARDLDTRILINTDALPPSGTRSSACAWLSTKLYMFVSSYDSQRYFRNCF